MLGQRQIKKSNGMMVKTLMDLGELEQVFIIEAIRYYSEKVAGSTLDNCEEIHKDAAAQWRAVAIDIQDRLRTNYEEPKGNITIST